MTDFPISFTEEVIHSFVSRRSQTTQSMSKEKGLRHILKIAALMTNNEI